MSSRAQRRVRHNVAAAVLLLTAACGSAISHDQVVQAAHGSANSAVAAGIGGATSGANPLVGGPSGIKATGGTTSGGSGGSGVGGGTGSGANASGGTGTTSTTGGGQPTGGDTSPLIIASVGDYSGAPGVALKPVATGMQVWAQDVNARGGIDGHPVKLIVQDDQADPGKYRQILQDLVENQHVIAFVGNEPALTSQAGTSYLESVKVPMIGAGDGSPAWRSSPMMFSTVGDADALSFGDLAAAAKLGKPKIALLTCVEASSCTGWKSAANKYASRAGVSLVYQASISITQADFTTECINAKRAQAQVMAVIADAQTEARAAKACAQQGYKPTFIAAAPNDSELTNPDLSGGVIGAMHSFPFFGVPGNPLADAYTAALKRYGADTNKALYLASGWADGKLFEDVVTRGIGAKKPSSVGVLAGLHSIPRGFTLGGLLPPLQFSKSGNNAQPFCYFPGFISAGQWHAPNGMQPVCAAR